MNVIIIIIIVIITSIEFSPGGSSSYTSTDKTNRNKVYIIEKIQNTVQPIQNTVKYKYTYYQKTHTIVKTPTHYKTHTYTHPHITKKLTQPQYKIHTKCNSYNTNR
jgi:murein tripeptide amidase MpaA